MTWIVAALKKVGEQFPEVSEVLRSFGTEDGRQRTEDGGRMTED